jgi:O-antigen ligase
MMRSRSGGRSTSRSRLRADEADRATRLPKRGLIQRVRYWILIFTLAWAPLPLGSARPWAWDILGLAAMLLLALSAFEEASKPSRRGLLKPLLPALVMGGLVAAWIVFQALPWDIAGWHHPLWDRGGEVLGAKLAASLSIDREQSWIHLFRLMTYAAYFFVAWQAARRGEAAEAIFRAIAVIGAVYAIYGLIEFVSPEPRILWLVKDTYITDVTSTFVNRNSYATFAGLGVLANLVLIANVLIKNTDVTSRASLWLSLIDSLLGRARWLILGLVLVSGSLLMSHSRAGLAATLSAVLALTALVLMAPSARAPWRFWFGVFVAAGSVAILVLTGASTLNRLDLTSIDGELRPKINEVLLRAIHDNFLSGTGLGSFPDIFPLYQPLSVPGFVDLAHNDYLENLLELGVPAALLLFATVAYLAGRCVLGVFRRRRDVIYPCAGAAATALIGVHSIFDFSMQIPAVAVTYAVILGVGVAQSVNSRDAV